MNAEIIIRKTSATEQAFFVKRNGRTEYSGLAWNRADANGDYLEISGSVHEFMDIDGSGELREVFNVNPMLCGDIEINELRDFLAALPARS